MKLYEEEYIDEKIIGIIQKYVNTMISILIKSLFVCQIDIFLFYVVFYLILKIKWKDVQLHVNYQNQLK